jgi:hypothetical protein
MYLIDQQECIEKQYNRKHIDGYIRKEILANPEMVNKIEQGVQLINEYMSKSYYPSKNARIDQIRELNIESLVISVFTGIAYSQREELYTSVTAQLAGRLKFSDKRDAIITVAELVAVLCMTDAFDIQKASKSSSLMIISRIPLSEDTIRFIANTRYLPPMVCEPLDLSSNYQSGYLTHNDSLILGIGNHHEGDICLDVLNKVNKVQLRLDTDFLSTIEEVPTFELDSQDKEDQWAEFKRQSYELYLLLAKSDNKFYLTHRVDKRGRIYAQGYHVTTQGTSFKKASIELANQELVTGV